MKKPIKQAKKSGERVPSLYRLTAIGCGAAFIAFLSIWTGTTWGSSNLQSEMPREKSVWEQGVIRTTATQSMETRWTAGAGSLETSGCLTNVYSLEDGEKKFAYAYSGYCPRNPYVNMREFTRGLLFLALTVSVAIALAILSVVHHRKNNPRIVFVMVGIVSVWFFLLLFYIFPTTSFFSSPYIFVDPGMGG